MSPPWHHRPRCVPRAARSDIVLYSIAVCDDWHAAPWVGDTRDSSRHGDRTISLGESEGSAVSTDSAIARGWSLRTRDPCMLKANRKRRCPNRNAKTEKRQTRNEARPVSHEPQRQPITARHGRPPGVRPEAGPKAKATFYVTASLIDFYRDGSWEERCNLGELAAWALGEYGKWRAPTEIRREDPQMQRLDTAILLSRGGCHEGMNAVIRLVASKARNEGAVKLLSAGHNVPYDMIQRHVALVCRTNVHRL